MTDVIHNSISVSFIPMGWFSLIHELGDLNGVGSCNRNNRFDECFKPVVTERVPQYP